MTSEKPIGYVNGNKTHPIYPVKRGQITTCAFIMCSQCFSTIDTMGGPRSGAWCIKCTEKKNDE